ncbi:MAG: thioredoxin family protein [Prevotella sp.]|nr:thioredoxin family protein [Prevotella sp.]
MKKSIIIALFAALFALTATAQENQKKVYNEEIDPLEQIDNALAQAKSEGKFAIVQLGGNWCPWCLRFANFITNDEEISRLINENFVYIHVNYHPRKSKETGKAGQTAELLRRLGQPARFGFPVMVVLDGDGKVLHLQDSGYLEEGKGYDKKKVLSFFKNWTPKAVRGE